MSKLMKKIMVMVLFSLAKSIIKANIKAKVKRGHYMRGKQVKRRSHTQQQNEKSPKYLESPKSESNTNLSKKDEKFRDNG
ncbi:MAG: hypothetical protein K0Q74_795 [Gammaproteobacteria bacterium]|nr:hypothetical protein [Gammaproteobacteria bacterium]